MSYRCLFFNLITIPAPLNHQNQGCTTEKAKTKKYNVITLNLLCRGEVSKKLFTYHEDHIMPATHTHDSIEEHHQTSQWYELLHWIVSTLAVARVLVSSKRDDRK